MSLSDSVDQKIFQEKISVARRMNLSHPDMNTVVVAVGAAFIGTAYEEQTLEKGDSEGLISNLTGVDCTTFLEYTLAISRCVRNNDTLYESFQKELVHIRYRDGILNSYASRLHYFSDWIFNNAEKNVVTDITKNIGGVPVKFHLDFMSAHPQLYPQLVNHTEFVDSIRVAERRINKLSFSYIPKKDIPRVEANIQSGDLIAITTSIKGLDIGHVGIAVKEDDNRIYFMHASNVNRKVKISESPLADYVQKNNKQTGIIVLRPVEPMK